MLRVFIGAILAGLVIGGAVVGVRIASRDSDSVAASPSETPEVGSPAEVAAQFAEAWTNGDLDALYLLLTPATQVRVPSADFTASYESFSSELTLESVTAEVDSVSGTVARLRVHLTTAYFGDFDYTTVLNLARPGSRWLVEWQPTAIHPEMTGGRTFRGNVERPARGTIFDRSGEPLAITRDVPMLGLNREAVADKATFAAAVLPFGFTQEQVDAAFADPAPLNHRIAVGPIPEARLEEAAVALRGVAGAILYVETTRVHPLGAAAAHVVGYTRELTAEELAEGLVPGARAGDRIGAVGLEAGLEERLAGRPGAELTIVEADGVTVVRTLQESEFVSAQDVTTTLDAAVLRATYARLGSRAGAAVVIDPRTNEILALNSSPSFDPDAFERGDQATLNALTEDPNNPLTNRATIGLYSAGSTFKLVTGSAGLADGGFSTTDTIFCGSTWAGVDPPRRNWEGAQGPLTIAEGLMRSCNPVFYEIGLQLYNTTDGALSKMARAFGFGAPTGVVGIYEEAGLVPDAEWKRTERNDLWYPGDEVNLAIGQGDLLITPLQLANAYSSFLARQLRAPVILAGAEATARGAIPLDDIAYAHLRHGLELVTGEGGTARSTFWAAGYTDFGGKSGTAEDAGEQQHVLFVAYAPRAAPAAVAAVVLDDGQSGSLEAGPIARDIVLAVLGE
jgi:penicillin-binding protein 2